MRHIILFCTFALSIIGENASTAVSVEKIKGGVEAQIQGAGIPKAQIGVWIGYKDQKIFSLNGEEKFMPASVSKLLPAAAALDWFSSSHQFETNIAVQGQIENGALRGDLYLVGGGDPSFTSENLWILVNDFVREGVKKIEGDIVVDDRRFDSVRFDPGRDENGDDRDKAYTAPVGAMSFNWNSVNVVIRPGDQIGEAVKVFANPSTEYIEIINEARTVRGSGSDIEVIRLGLRFTDEGEARDVIKVKGTYGTQNGELSVFRNITKPDYWSGYNLKSFLKQRGIEVVGKVRLGEKPSAARIVAKAQGLTLSHAIAAMLKVSNNYMAEMVTKNLGASAQSGEPASMEAGLEAIRKFLDRQGVKRADYSLTSPSGLSRRNKFRPKDLHDLLHKLRLTLVNFPEFLAAQSIGGTDGTLAERMKGTVAQGRIRGKTGTISGVVCLAGYAMRPDGEVITFAFMINGDSGTAAARALVDKMALALFL